MARAQKYYVHFRASRDLIEALEELTAQSANGNKSEIIRSLLYQALGEPAARAAALQATFDYASVRRMIFAKLADSINATMQRTIDEVIAEGALE